MASMRAAVLTGPGQLRVEQVALPEPGPGQVRVKLEGCGVCASNLTPWAGPEWMQFPTEPGALGHEGWGVVDAVGSGVNGLREGDRVAALSFKSYADYDIADAAALIPIPDALANTPFPGEPLGCAMNIFARTDVAAGQTVAIIGIGSLGGYRPSDIRFVAGWDIDRRKVGRDISAAIFEKPNCTTVFCDHVPPAGATVRMGRVLDGYSEHMAEYSPERSFMLAGDEPEAEKHDIVRTLRETETDVLMNYLPVGSQAATEFYAECALEAGVAFVNNMPVFIASDPAWGERFRAAGVPVIGDDIKAQLGATIVHRVLTDLFAKRGVKLDRTYQLNTGGNTDFLNMLERKRLKSKKLSKTEAVQSVAHRRLDDENIHIGPSDYVAWQNDNKICFLRMEGQLFGGVPMNLELRLSVEDSPNSAGVAIDMIRCAKLALDRGLAGPIEPASAYFCKHPPTQSTDDAAHEALEAFILGDVAAPR